MATYKNYSMSRVMQTTGSERINGFEQLAERSQPFHPIVDITGWSTGKSAGCAGTNRIAVGQGAEVTMHR